MKKFRTLTAALLAVVLSVTFMFGEMPVAEATSYVTYPTASSSYKASKYYTALTQVEFTGDPRVDVVNIARSQLGYQEAETEGSYSGEVPGGNNYTEYGYWYGMPGAQWCAQFVSWCVGMAGVSTEIVLKHQYTEYGSSFFAEKGQRYNWSDVAKATFTPAPGDIVYFYSGTAGRTVNHVGIVEKFENNTLYTIEGNASSAEFTTDGGCCCRRTYSLDSTYVKYICRPAYERTEPGSAVIPDVNQDNGYYTETGKYQVTTEGLNVRNAPVTGASVGSFSSGDVFECLEVVHITDGNKYWAKIDYNGTEAYISLNATYIAPAVESTPGTGELLDPPASYGITPEKTNYIPGDSVKISAYGTALTDWIGVYKKGENPASVDPIYKCELSALTNRAVIITDLSKATLGSRDDISKYTKGLPSGDYTISIFKSGTKTAMASAEVSFETLDSTKVKDPVWFWNFGEEKAYVGDGVSDITMGDEYVTLADKNSDGYIHPGSSSALAEAGVPALNLDLARCIVVRIRITTGASNANRHEVYIGKDGNAYQRPGYPANTTEWQYIIINCSGLTAWNGTPDWFRIDPVNFNGTVADIDWIAFFENSTDAKYYAAADKLGIDVNAPIEEPTDEPTDEPTAEPTEAPSDEPTEKPSEPPVDDAMAGDVNGDSKVNMADVVAIRRYLVNNTEYPLTVEAAGDVTGDGKVNMADVVAVRRYLVNAEEYPLG